MRTPGGPDAAAAEFWDVEVDVPPGVPVAEAVGPPDVVHSVFVGSLGTLTCMPLRRQLGPCPCALHSRTKRQSICRQWCADSACISSGLAGPEATSRTESNKPLLQVSKRTANSMP